ncbi:MAG: acetyl-CoA carboxylase biotin carboxyl carrier protein [Treponema sp.]|nr:acetyl-CoA carboxylase biotin carboxyl carrier protein [Treponema sp.]
MNDKLILTIIDKFSSGSIGELDLDDGTTHLILRREQSAPPAVKAEAAEARPANTAAPVIATNAAAEGAAGEKITSPIVGTFYSAPSPDAPPFVKPGSRVKAGQTLCILEAMKMMNHLVAEFDCQIIESHAANGDTVEYGQSLFTVKRL